MANCLATPLMLQREVLAWLPSDAVTFAEEAPGGDVLVAFRTCGGEGSIRVCKYDRTRSLNDISEIYKPSIDKALQALWTLS